MARIITEKQLSRLPANANLSGLSKGIDMKMNMIEVAALDGDILISQEDGFNGIENVVIITADQAELVCRWIKDAAEPIKADK